LRSALIVKPSEPNGIDRGNRTLLVSVNRRGTVFLDLRPHASVVREGVDLLAKIFEVGVGNVEQDRTGFGHETDQASIRARVIELIGRKLRTRSWANGDDLPRRELVARCLRPSGDLALDRIELAYEALSMRLGVRRRDPRRRAPA
jgi:hypothetical protein